MIVGRHGAVRIQPARNGLGVYGVDPDGNQFEILWMLPRQDWGIYDNTAIVERLSLPDELETWAGTRTAGTIVHE